MNKNQYLMSRRRNVWIALGLAGLAYYFLKLNSEERKRLNDTIKQYGTKALDKIPDDLKQKLGLNKERI